jgi:hypothetical protein
MPEITFAAAPSKKARTLPQLQTSTQAKVQASMLHVSSNRRIGQKKMNVQHDILVQASSTAADNVPELPADTSCHLSSELMEQELHSEFSSLVVIGGSVMRLQINRKLTEPN